MLKNLRKNEEGIIYVTVLMIVIVMTVLTISIVTMNVNQIRTSEAETKRIQAEVLAQGALAYMFADQISTTPSLTLAMNETVGNEVFEVIGTITDDDSGPESTDPLNIIVNF